MPLLAIRSFPFGAKGRLYFTRVHSVKLYGSEMLSFMEVRLDRLKSKALSEKTGMMQEWLVGCMMLGLQIEFFRGIKD